MKFYITKTQQLLISFILSFGIVTNAGNASILPVTDTTALPSTIINAVTTIIEEVEIAMGLATQAQEYAQQIEQYQKQFEAYQQQVKDYENQYGSYGMGDLLGAESDASRGWSSEGWQNTIKSAQSGDLPDASQELKDALKGINEQQNVLYSEDIYSSGSDSRQAIYYDTQTATTTTAMAISDVAYSTTNKRTENIEFLGSQIELAKDQKASLDLNNRLLIQVLHQQNQLIQLISVSVQNQATENYSVANSIAADAENNDLNLSY